MGNYGRITAKDRVTFEELRRLRWPEGVACPRCDEKDPSYNERRMNFQCRSRRCRYQFSVTTKTRLHNTRVSLAKSVDTLTALYETAREDNARYFTTGFERQSVRAGHLFEHGIAVFYRADLEEKIGSKSQQTAYRYLKLMESTIAAIGLTLSTAKMLEFLLSAEEPCKFLDRQSKSRPTVILRKNKPVA